MNDRQRTLPVSPQHREFTVKVNGTPVPRSAHLLSASVSAQVNKIASARLVYLDGSASEQDFPLLSNNLFAQGNEVEVLAGATDDAELIFHGLIVAQKIKLRESSSPQLIITCKHAAVKSTLTRNGRYFEQVRDSDLIETLLSEYRLNINAETTQDTHEQLVQYDCSDWDFCLQRARSNGLLLFTRGDELQFTPAIQTTDPVCNLEYGATLLSADLETDARTQSTAFKSLFWSSADQELTQQEGESNIQSQPGNTESAQLAESMGNPDCLLRQPTEFTRESQQWADASRQYAELSRVTGTLKTQGIATVKPGDNVTLSGLSDAFNGRALVTGVRHEMDSVSGWRSYFQVGGLDDLGQENNKPLAQMSGLQIATVVDNEDGGAEYRVQVRLPMLGQDSEGIWAKIASADAGDDRGSMIRPELGDEVIVGFIQNDPRKAVILGMLHSSTNPPPAEPDNENNIKLIKTKSGIEVRLDDEEGSVTLNDANDNRIVMNSEGISIESARDLTLTAANNIKLEAGENIENSASANFTAEGSANAEITGSGGVTISGAIVRIN